MNSHFIERGLAEKTSPMTSGDYWKDFWRLIEEYPPEKRTEYTDAEFCGALAEYRTGAIRNSLRSENPLTVMFALFDRRVGRRTLEKLGSELEKRPEWLRELYRIRTAR